VSIDTDADTGLQKHPLLTPVMTVVLTIYHSKADCECCY